VAARAAFRAQQAAARAQEAANEAADDLRVIAAAPPPEPGPGWLGRMRQKLEARTAFGRGRGLYEARDLTGARPHLEQAVRLDPDHDEARALLGWLEYFSEAPQSAIVMFKTALRRQPTWEGLYNGLGWSRLRVDRPHLARDAFRAALDANPQYTDALAGLGLALYELGDYVAAMPALDQAVATLEGALGRGAPELIDLREATAWSLYRLGRYGEAAVEFERVARARPEGPDVQAALGWAYLKGGRRGDARAAFQRALELAPNSTDAARGLALASQ
jgi:tetratricopeptide (TPR) repeat protein